MHNAQVLQRQTQKNEHQNAVGSHTHLFCFIVNDNGITHTSYKEFHHNKSSPKKGIVSSRPRPVTGTELTRWPVKLAAAQNVNMEVVHRLAALWAIVNYSAEALVQALFLGNLLGHEQDVP